MELLSDEPPGSYVRLVEGLEGWVGGRYVFFSFSLSSSFSPTHPSPIVLSSAFQPLPPPPPPPPPPLPPTHSSRHPDDLLVLEALRAISLPTKSTSSSSSSSSSSPLVCEEDGLKMRGEELIRKVVEVLVKASGGGGKSTHPPTHPLTYYTTTTVPSTHPPTHPPTSSTHSLILIYPFTFSYSRRRRRRRRWRRRGESSCDGGSD